MNSVLFAGFVILFLSTCIFYLLSGGHVEEKRVFHYISMTITGIASIAYLVMAFDGGKMELTLESGDTRDFYYIRYIECAPRAEGRPAYRPRAIRSRARPRAAR